MCCKHSFHSNSKSGSWKTPGHSWASKHIPKFTSWRSFFSSDNGRNKRMFFGGAWWGLREGVLYLVSFSGAAEASESQLGQTYTRSSIRTETSKVLRFPAWLRPRVHSPKSRRNGERDVLFSSLLLLLFSPQLKPPPLVRRIKSKSCLSKVCLAPLYAETHIHTHALQLGFHFIQTDGCTLQKKTTEKIGLKLGEFIYAWAAQFLRPIKPITRTLCYVCVNMQTQNKTRGWTEADPASDF